MNADSSGQHNNTPINEPINEPMNALMDGPTDTPSAEALSHAGLPLLYQDAHLLAIHKPAGLLVHRSNLDAHETDDVVTRLRAVFTHAPNPVHRLDKGTSGVLLLAKDSDTAARMGQAFIANEVLKRYWALVRGWPADSGQTDTPLARDPELPSTGQPLLDACTHWQVLRRLDWPVATHRDFPSTRGALVLVSPQSGRRHQIRRHFKQLGHPLLGDATHGKGPLNRALAAHFGRQRLWLHALELHFKHPHTGRAVCVMAPPGEEWLAFTPDKDKDI